MELLHELVEFIMMKKQPPPIIYQDCNAVVMLVTKGGGMMRTKSLRARMNSGREACAIIEYIKAKRMRAYGFGKACNPTEHKSFAMMVQGEEAE